VLVLLVGLASTLFSFAQFFVDLFVEPFDLGDVFFFQLLFKALHLFLVHLNGKRFDAFPPVSEILGSAFTGQIFTSLFHETILTWFHEIVKKKFGPRREPGARLCCHHRLSWV
jgi:hypothetical protein